MADNTIEALKIKIVGQCAGHIPVPDFIADVDALIAAVRAENVQYWQPIETAPMDGTQILIWINGIEPRPRIAYWADRGLEYGWFALQTQHLLGVPVTHWMPLPTAPPS